MNADEKILQVLDDLQADVQMQGEQLATLQDDVTTIKTVTGKIPAIEQRLEHHGTLLTGGSPPSFGPSLSPCTIGQYPSFPIVFISQSKGPALNQLDFVVEPFGHAVGVTMPNVARNRFKPPP